MGTLLLRTGKTCCVTSIAKNTPAREAALIPPDLLS